MRRRPSRPFDRDADAVSDVVGSILLVSITVALMGGLSLAVLSIQGPPDTIHADLLIEALPGTGDWGGGDEEVRVRHVGGEPVPRTVQVHISVGGTTVVYDPVDQGFADGALRLGESWSVTQTIQESDEVAVTIVDPVANALVTANGDVGVVPISDPITGTVTYVDDFLANSGTVASFSDIQSGSDGGATGTLTEEDAGAGSPTSAAFSPSGLSASSGVLDPNNAIDSDDADATFEDAGQFVEVQGFSIPDGSTINSVQVWFEAQRGGGGGAPNPPDMLLSYKIGGVPGAASGTFAVDATGDALYGPVTVTESLTEEQAESMTLVLTRLTADNSARDADVDHIYMVVSYTPVGATDMDIELHFAGVPSATTHEVQIRYRTSVDTFDLQVWDSVGATWNTRDQLASVTTDQLLYTLTADEYNGGAPLLRVLDRDTGAGIGSIEMDYVRVVSE